MSRIARELRLAPASPRDAEALASLSRRQIETGLVWRWTSARIAAKIRAPDTEVVAARDGTALCGFAAIDYAFEARRAHLLLLAVEPGWRRCGVGRALYEWVEKMARLGGVLEIGLEVRESNAGARAFYAALGFREGGRVPGYYEGREHALELHKRLGPRVS